MPAIDHISPVWSRAFTPSLEVERGEGCYLYDINGKRYLDFTCGIGVTNTGHAHPKVVKAIQDQAAKLIHGQANIVYHKPLLDLVDELMTIMPGQSGLDSFFFTTVAQRSSKRASNLPKSQQVEQTPLSSAVHSTGARISRWR